MSAFSWKKEEEVFKRRAHGAVTVAMHSALACGIRPGGRGDRAAQFAAEALWSDHRRLLERLRSTERDVATLQRELNRG